MDFYTVLYLILLSDHNDNFGKYNKNILADYHFNGIHNVTIDVSCPTDKL